MKQLAHALLALGLGALAAEAQRPLNLDFEIPPTVWSDSALRPWGWSRPSTPATYALDSVGPRSGRFALRLNAGGSTARTAVTLSAATALGKEVRVTAWVRRDRPDVTAAVTLVIQRRGRPPVVRLAVDSAAVSGNDDAWVNIPLRVPVDSTATTIEISLIHAGSGTAWFDQLELTVGGGVVTSVPSELSPVGVEEVRWLRQHAVPLFPPDTSALDDLRPFRALAGTSTVFGLAEPTHGTREITQMRRRILEYLVRDAGFSVIALEDNQFRMRIVDAYVNGGPGTAAEVVAVLMPTWRTAEMVELIEWIRGYNQAVPSSRRIRFAGFDAQTWGTDLVMDSVVALFRRVEPAAADSIVTAYASMRLAWSEPSPRRDFATMQQWASDAQWVVGRLRTSRERFQAMGGEQFTWAERGAVLIHQAAAGLIAQTSFHRDSVMAVNTAWLAQQMPGARIVTWGHQLHLGRAQGTMGSYLRALYPGLNSTALTFTTYEGTVRAWDEQLGRRTSGRLIEAPAGTLDEALHRVGLPRFLLDLREAAAGTRGAWLRELREHRSVEATMADYSFRRARFADAFDFVIHLDRTSAALPIVPR